MISIEAVHPISHIEGIESINFSGPMKEGPLALREKCFELLKIADQSLSSSLSALDDSDNPLLGNLKTSVATKDNILFGENLLHAQIEAMRE